jgi:hypothetical protein
VWLLAPIATTAIGLGFYMLHNTLRGMFNNISSDQSLNDDLLPKYSGWGLHGELAAHVA